MQKGVPSGSKASIAGRTVGRLARNLDMRVQIGSDQRMDRVAHACDCMCGRRGCFCVVRGSKRVAKGSGRVLACARFEVEGCERRVDARRALRRLGLTSSHVSTVCAMRGFRATHLGHHQDAGGRGVCVRIDLRSSSAGGRMCENARDGEHSESRKMSLTGGYYISRCNMSVGTQTGRRRGVRACQRIPGRRSTGV